VATTTSDHGGGNHHSPLNDPNNPPYIADPVPLDNHTDGNNHQAMHNVTNFQLIGRSYEPMFL
jgi:hypothetical protein